MPECRDSEIMDLSQQMQDCQTKLETMDEFVNRVNELPQTDTLQKNIQKLKQDLDSRVFEINRRFDIIEDKTKFAMPSSLEHQNTGRASQQNRKSYESSMSHKSKSDEPPGVVSKNPSYDEEVSKQKGPSTTDKSLSKGRSVESRIDHLEKLVISLK